MTDRQKVVLEYVRLYLDAHGYSPTEAEIAKWLGVAQPQAHRLVKALEDGGHVRLLSTRRPIVVV